MQEVLVRVHHRFILNLGVEFNFNLWYPATQGPTQNPDPLKKIHTEHYFYIDVQMYNQCSEVVLEMNLWSAFGIQVG